MHLQLVILIVQISSQEKFGKNSKIVPIKPPIAIPVKQFSLRCKLTLLDNLPVKGPASRHKLVWNDTAEDTGSIQDRNLSIMKCRVKI